MWHAIPSTSALPLLKVARPGSLGQGPALCMYSASLFAGIVLHAPGMHINQTIAEPIHIQCEDMDQD